MSVEPTNGGRGTAIMIGAGPAGLTAAFELLRRTRLQPVVLEQSGDVGGISRTVEHAGNRIDLGGHRFFSKADRVMRWWLDMMPLEAVAEGRLVLGYQGQRRELGVPGAGPDPDREDRVMLVRQRRSRILYGGQLYAYPVRLSADTLRKLGARRTTRIGLSYLWRLAHPRRPERTLEDFFINRFGDELYRTFFRAYTEKVWGRPCSEISAEWGAQRVKGLSVARAVRHMLRSRARRSGGDLAQRGHDTSLIERFLYPKYGPGHMWRTVAAEVRAGGGEIRLHQRVVGLDVEAGRVRAVSVEDVHSRAVTRLSADWVLSTMPVVELIRALGAVVPPPVQAIAEGLVYRDFITVGLLLRRFRLAGQDRVPDNWVYVQEPGVKMGRIQIFNNWSPYMVRDPRTTWIGLEYFATAGDALWSLRDDALVTLAAEELRTLGIAEPSDVQDSVVIREPRAYPAYLGTYPRLGELRAWVDGLENLFLLGRNGQHRYNNQDHSMLTAMTAVDNIVVGVSRKDNVWAVNTETEYHEER